MRIRGIIEHKIYWWGGSSWIDDESQAEELNQIEAERRLRIINANNRHLDSAEQVDAEIVKD